MKIQLLEPEIKLALEIYIKSRIKFDDDSHLEMEFTAGRNPPAVSVDINIVENGTVSENILSELLEEDAGEKPPFSDSQNNLPFTNAEDDSKQSFLQED